MEQQGQQQQPPPSSLTLKSTSPSCTVKTTRQSWRESHTSESSYQLSILPWGLCARAGSSPGSYSYSTTTRTANCSTRWPGLSPTSAVLSMMTARTWWTRTQSPSSSGCLTPAMMPRSWSRPSGRWATSLLTARICRSWCWRRAWWTPCCTASSATWRAPPCCANPHGCSATCAGPSRSWRNSMQRCRSSSPFWSRAPTMR
mmetsp:Transcript_2329/g.5205  ORF Transcript_2329/g.5205 Transcript_2329/m.5205 type:complete len:201 (+) Transcript_2329:711-1313(+)